VRWEDLVEAPRQALAAVCERIGVSPARCLERPTWNGRRLAEVYPWGTIRTPTPAANRAAAAELSAAESREIQVRAAPYLGVFGYDRWRAARER
jgi:hypothetical protein